MRFPLLLLAVLLSVPACAQQPPGVVGSPVAATPTPAAQTLKTVSSQAGEIAVQEMVAGLDHPWGMDFLPDGRLLVTERDSGKLLLVSPDGQRQEVTGVPEVVARGQGGLMDVAAHPDFAANGWVYLSYAAPAEGRQSATTLGRGKLVEGRLEGFQVLFSQDPVAGGTHFGNRIVLTKDGYLFLATGERFQFTPAQDLGQTLGKVIRLKDDGTIPEGNPFVGQQGARPEIWSYGHRNIEAAVLHPQTGALWIAEMGPKGGDELNLIEAGKNYGWPLVSWGDNYDNSPIPKPSTRPDLTDALHHWTPVISPSGMLVYSGALFPAWNGHFLIGGLTTGELVRVRLEGGKFAEEERIELDARIRDVAQASDGTIYVLTDSDDGAVWKLTPAR